MPPERTSEMEPAADAPSLQAEAAASDFLEFEGSTVFAASPAPTYRYSLTLKNGKLRIWLEDCDSKKQWRTADLSLDEYVDVTNAIPNATAVDYTEMGYSLLPSSCFRELLEAGGKRDGNLPRAFKRIQGDTFRLEILMEFRALLQTREVSYSFTMELMSVERIDVLESRLRDLKEASLRGDTAVCQLKEEIDEGIKLLRQDLKSRDAKIARLEAEIQGRGEYLVTHAEARKMEGNNLVWEKVGPGSPVIIGSIISNLTPGTYRISAIVNCTPNEYNGCIQLMKDGDCIQSAFVGYAQGYQTSTHLDCTASVEETTKISIQYGHGQSSSYLTLVKTSFLTLARLAK